MKTGLKPVSKPDLPGEAEITLADITEAKSLGWSPRISIEEGLRRTIEYLRTKAMNATLGAAGAQ